MTHPFPSILDGLVAAGVALVAGASATLAAGIALSMTLVQLGIGAINDVVDADSDRGRKPDKPIPAGLVDPRRASAAAVSVFALGILLALAIRPVLGLLLVGVAGIGLAYDLRLKGTAWSWLPFAAGIPLLPVAGWLGATGGLHPVFAVIVPASIAAGAALSVGNALVDVERDRDAGATSVADRLGLRSSSRVVAGLLVAVGTLAIGSGVAVGAPPSALVAIATLAVVPVAGAVIGAAAREPGGREWAWRIEAVGLAGLAVTWLAIVVPLARPT